jgi:hypothetical protein
MQHRPVFNVIFSNNTLAKAQVAFIERVYYNYAGVEKQ